MFNIADGTHRFAFKKHALGDRGSGEFDAGFYSALDCLLF
jgi:hypothetical protein